MFEIFPQGASLGRLPVTSVQVVPPSRVTCTSPSFEPAHITPACTGDSARANSVAPSNVIRLSVVSPDLTRNVTTHQQSSGGVTTYNLMPLPGERRLDVLLQLFVRCAV